MIVYAVIGSGWRAEFYMRLAKLLPDKFKVSAACVRNEEKARLLEEKYGVKTSRTLEEALSEKCDFVVDCINKQDITDMALKISRMGYFVLSETPVTKYEGSSLEHEKIQVAEQFHLKGSYVAVKKIIDSGIIGKVTHINISCCHDYHAMSLVRFFLDDYECPEKIAEYTLDDPMLKTHGRGGELTQKNVEDRQQTVRIYRFKNASVIYDHNKEQYFSPIRKNRLVIRGTHGEIENDTVRYFNEDGRFVESEIKHEFAGALDGFFNNKITFENKVLYEYPYKEARFSEEETAIAECLVRMKAFTLGKGELYSYKKAYEDYIFAVDKP